MKKISKLQIPNTFKKYGWIIFGISIISMFIIVINENEFYTNKPINWIVKYGILIGLLIVSLSKEPIEDELIINIRMRSYMISFIFIVLKSMISPIASIGVSTLLHSESKPMEADIDFAIVLMLLLTQIIIFNFLKKSENE